MNLSKVDKGVGDAPNLTRRGKASNVLVWAPEITTEGIEYNAEEHVLATLEISTISNTLLYLTEKNKTKMT